MRVFSLGITPQCRIESASPLWRQELLPYFAYYIKDGHVLGFCFASFCLSYAAIPHGIVWQIHQYLSGLVLWPHCQQGNSGPVITNRMEVLQPNLVKSRGREIGFYNDSIVLKFGGHLGTDAAKVTVKFHCDCKSLKPNLTTLRLHEILWQDVGSLSQ